MEINRIKEHLRFIEDETESVKRDLEETQRMSPIDQAKFLPIGLGLLMLGIMFGIAAVCSILYQLGGFLFILNGVLAIGLIYFGTIITKLGYKFNRVLKKANRVIQKSEELKDELEKLLAEKQ